MALLNFTLICTVLNEEESIGEFIDSIANQSVLPSEVIIVDGGSKDKTVIKINRKIKQYKKLNIKVFIKKGNRSMGRNEAIKKSSFEIILSTDSGCILDKNWVKNITKPFKNKSVEVVAGYYKGLPKNAFQKCLVPYVLVMEDKIDKNNFLPATRSMAFKKSIWKRVGGFNEDLSHNEDYAFANKLIKKDVKITFAKEAIVRWKPRKTLLQTFKMFYRFALGDIQAGLYREKVIYLLLRYIFAFHLLILSIIMKSIFLNGFVFLSFAGYIIWAINKNYKYVNNLKALFYLPLLQFVSDASVILGTCIGFAQRFSIGSIFVLTIKNKTITLFILFYLGLMLYLIQWGIPNLNHPFNYAMDEWHFSQALRTFIKYGTGSISGAASIPLYHIISSIIFLLPFYLLGIVNPLAIKNTLDNLPMQHILFIILRLHTLFYGVLSVIVIYSLIKNYFKVYAKVFTLLFIFSPIFLMLTNYYKYDVTLVFWIVLSLYLLFKYLNDKKYLYFILSGVSLGLALSTKFTAAPFIISYVFSYFLFSKKIIFKQLFTGVFIAFFIFLFVGIPDTILYFRFYYELLYSTLVQEPTRSVDFNLGYPSWYFLLFKEFPSIFGYFLTLFFYISVLFWSLALVFYQLKGKLYKYKAEFFILVGSFSFLLSTLIFNVDGGGNRALVLLPFMVILSALFMKYVFNQLIVVWKRILMTIIILALSLQIAQSLSWISVKFYDDPRSTSSEWILKNLPKESTIGIENIPIYQMLPDIVLREFYELQQNPKIKTNYKYKVLQTTASFPEYVVVTNDFDQVNYVNSSTKKSLVEELKKQNYVVRKTFSPNLQYYQVFSDKIYFVVANILPIPVTVSIYEKQ
ncbi:MAG: glycosyltransferase [Cyanobacteria bacterium]|nr:glycosyltransferase [Cyanobacteriota bacterium]